MRQITGVLAAGLAGLLLAGCTSSSTPAPMPAALSGFTAAQAATERQNEAAFQAVPDPGRMRDAMQRLSLKPHALGQPYDKDNADWILAQFQSYGLPARIETFQVLFPTPKVRELELTAPTHYTAKLSEPAVQGDPTSSAPGQLPPYNAYSIDGDVTGPLVYVNYGLPSDYDQLKKMGVDVRGKIVLARYGQSWRGVKPKVAAEHGAIGCLIYSEPKDDGYYRGDIFPEGAWRPWAGVQRGSVMDVSQGEGDPSTPALAEGNLNPPRLPVSQITTITKIPTLPISYGDALPLLEAVRGQVAPEAWRGVLPTTYHVGPGPAVVHLKVSFHWDVVPLYDVIAQIPGSEFPDQWVIRANHHDAWVFGASDPLSGTVALLEEARGLGALLKQGWRPRRTIILAAWDGEEPMTLGSTAWALHHAPELETKAVAYINSDNSGKGTLRIEASHTLEHFFNNVARAVNDPETGKPLWEGMQAAALRRANASEKKAIEGRTDLRLGALGSGSDWAAFLDHLAIASADLRFSGQGGGGGVYHSTYDDFYWFTHFSDTKFVYERALAQTMGTAVMRMADAPVLPFEFEDFADTMDLYLHQIETLRENTAGAPALNFEPLAAAIETLKSNASDYDRALEQAESAGKIFQDNAALTQVNRILYGTERDMQLSGGLPGRPWYKHALYATGTYTGYEVKTMPGLREAVEGKRWSEASGQIEVLRGVMQKVADAIASATKVLSDHD